MYTDLCNLYNTLLSRYYCYLHFTDEESTKELSNLLMVIRLASGRAKIQRQEIRVHIMQA